MTRRATYTCKDAAERMGEDVYVFYRNRQKRHEIEGMPQPISQFGQPRWDKLTFDAWCERHHPLKVPRAANDQSPRFAPAEASDDEHRAHLADVYIGVRRTQ